MREVAGILLALALAVLLYHLVSSRRRPPAYCRKPVLSRRGLEFFRRLQDALPACIVCPNVAVSSLIEPASPQDLQYTVRRYLAVDKVGYAVFNQNMHLVAVVELAQRKRRTRSETLRDACFASAGVRTVRFSARRLPSPSRIRHCIYAQAGTNLGHRGDAGPDDLTVEVPVTQPAGSSPWIRRGHSKPADRAGWAG